MAGMIQLRAVAGEAVTVGDVTVTPCSHALVVRLPIGGFVWNQPTSVLIARGERTELRPVFDVTMAAGLAALVIGVLAGLIVRGARTRREEALA
jgi:hypothetical protein